MPKPFGTTRRVEFCDTDLAGIVHFSNYFRFMEAAEVEFLRTLGLSVLLEWEGVNLAFPRVAASCEYHRPARFEDLLDISVTLENLGRKSMTYVFEFTRHGELLARGRLTSVCCRVRPDQSLEAIEIPATIRERLEKNV